MTEEELQKDALKRKVEKKFRKMYNSDREMVEGPVFPHISPFISKITAGRSKKIGNFWIDFKFSKNTAKSLKDTFIEHDKKNLENTYLASGIFHTLLFTHIGLEDRIEAGFNYAEALFNKDKVEDKYRDSEGNLDLKEMYENDGVNTNNLEFYYRNPLDYHIQFEEEDLGEWISVYESFRKQSSRTIEEFYEGEKGKELADLYSLMRTLAWRYHKVGLVADQNQDSIFDYNYLAPRFRHIEIDAALQTENYPEKSSKEGEQGYGYLSHIYESQIEIHDEYRVEQKNFMKKIGFASIFLFAFSFNRIRRNNYRLRYLYGE